MAEFCLECWNRINETSLGKGEVVISKDLDLCEGCGERKPVIVKMRLGYQVRWEHKRKQKPFSFFGNK